MFSVTRAASASLLALACLGAGAAQATQVFNGDFQSGTSGWTVSGSGNWGYQTGDDGRTDVSAFQAYSNDSAATLSQFIVTTAGTTYELIFWSRVTYDDVPGNVLTYAIGDAGPVSAPATTGYAMTSTSFTATSASTELTFAFETELGAGAWSLDDVSVTASASAVPLPGALPLLGGGLALLGVAARRRAG